MLFFLDKNGRNQFFGVHLHFNSLRVNYPIVNLKN